MSTVLLKNGNIVDGTGGPGFPGHLLIEGGRIKALIKEGESVPEADQVIDASGKVVAPGLACSSLYLA